MRKKRSVPKIDPNVILQPDELKIAAVASKYTYACAASRNVMHENYRKDMDRRFSVQEKINIEAKKAAEDALKKADAALNSNTISATQVSLCGEYIKSSTTHMRTTAITVLIGFIAVVASAGVSIYFNIKNSNAQNEVVRKLQEKINQDTKNQDQLVTFLKVYIPILKGMQKGGKHELDIKTY
jgi:hypothetical protein